MEHILRPKRVILSGIRSGRKQLEIRVCDDKRALVRVGDMLVFDFGDQEYRRKVTSIRRYDSFVAMLAIEDISRIMPGWTKEAILNGLQSIYSKEKEQLGVLVFELGTTL